MNRVSEKKKPQVASFISKLYSLMEDREAGKIVSWNEQGTEIRIKNQRSLEYFVLPTYFRHRNLVSFVRQLNNYGFSNVSNLNTRKGQLCFRNQYFQRDKKEMLNKIRRKTKKILNRQQQEVNLTQNPSPQLVNNFLQLGKECFEIVKNRPSILPDFTGILNIVNQVVFPQSKKPNFEPQSLKSFMSSQEKRATYNFLQTLKDSIPVSLKKCDSICSFDANFERHHNDMPQ